MTQSDLLELAKQGHPKAIADLINQSLQPKGITAKTTLKDGCLQVMLEATKVPNQTILADFICQGMISLGAQSIKSVKVHGRQINQTVPAWSQEFSLETPLESTAPPSSPTTGQRKQKPENRSRGHSSVGAPKQYSQESQSGQADALLGEAALDPSGLSQEYYEQLLSEIGHFPKKGKLSTAYYYAMPKLANAVFDLVESSDQIIDIIGVRYQGELGALLLTEEYLACFILPDFSRKATKAFILKLNQIQQIIAANNGLRIERKNAPSFSIYFNAKKLGQEFVSNKLSNYISVQKHRLIPSDRYEITFMIFGFLTFIFAILINLLALFAIVLFFLRTALGILN